MQLRRVTTKRNGQTYEYAQLVESYRREPDGMPVHRVLASLGKLAPTEFANLRAALEANRRGHRVRVVTAPATARPPRVLANLRYLDVAVLLALWNEWGLPALLAAILPARATDVPTADVIAALAIQRCVDPGSTLSATEWVPGSALPELLGFAPTAFNNTRLHRALDDLETVGPRLMAQLPRRYQDTTGAFTALFMDVTDAWFVGHGPALAQPGKTKEGLLRHKVGIALLCAEQGYPLRWEVLPGAAHDSTAMTDMVQALRGLRWVGTAPLICDRAMGHSAHVRTLAATGLRFLTAVTTTETPTYAATLDTAPWLALPTQTDRAAAVVEAAAAATAAGFARISDTLFVSDLGVVTIPGAPGGAAAPAASVPPAPAAAVPPSPPAAPRAPDLPAPALALRADAAPPSAATARGAVALAVAMRHCQAVMAATGRGDSLSAAAQQLGLSKSAAHKYHHLRQLPADLQQALLDGDAGGQPLAKVLAIAALPEPKQQRDAFALLCARPPRGDGKRQVPTAGPAPSSPPAPLQVRAVVYFNPDRFVEQRTRAAALCADLQAFAAKLNARGGRSLAKLTAAVDRKLRKHALLGAYDVTITARPDSRPLVTLTLREEEWARRRRYDGFTVLVGHHELPHTAAQLCQLYRDKDAVEKDFQTIKSVIHLRPVWHYTDAKVRAHVHLCMLALLLERTLEQRLQCRQSAARTLAQLEPCRLNRLTVADTVLYTPTDVTSDQQALLDALRLSALVDELSDRLTPR